MNVREEVDKKRKTCANRLVHRNSRGTWREVQIETTCNARALWHFQSETKRPDFSSDMMTFIQALEESNTVHG